MGQKRHVPKFLLAGLAFILKSAAGNYIVAGLAWGVALLIALGVAVVSGLSGVHAVVLFVAVGLVAYALTAMAANAYLPDHFLTRPAPAPHPDAPMPTAPERYEAEGLLPPMTEQEATHARNRERVVRANVQSVLDELHAVKREINDAIDDHGGFWESPLDGFKNTWPEVRDGLSAEPGFHVAYAATRDAWDAIWRADEARRNHHQRQPNPLSWEEARIEHALRAIDAAERALWQFLGEKA